MLTVEEGVDMNDEPVRARPARKRKGVARLETPADDDEDVEMASPVEDDRRDEQEDDDEADDIEEERPRKRLRKSGAVRKLEPTPEESDPVTDGGESEDEEGGGPSQGAKPRAPRAKRDGGKKLSKPLSAGAAGTIGRIQLYNIMCHRNLEVDFIDKVNFVTGQNGSGKSSILVALTLALGGKTRATSRGDSVKDVLYYGQSWGEIVVYLRNEGEEAYKPDIFGKHIRVVRRMTTTSTQYKLQNAEGTTISTKRSDLQDLLDHYHIDVSNPLCVLTQEMAKQFLANSSDEDKYKFFLIGTNLANLKKDIGHIKDRIHSILGSLPDMKAHRDQLGKKKTELERRFQEIEANRGLEEQIQQLKNQLAWSEAAEAEDAYQNKVEEEQKAQDKVARLDGRMGEYQDTLAPLDEKIAGKDQELRELDGEKSQKRGQERTLKQAHDAATSKLAEVGGEVRDMNSTVQNLKSQLRDIEKAIRDTQEKVAGRNREHLQRLEDQRQRLETDLEQIVAELEAAQQSRPAIEAEQRGLQGELRAAEDERARLVDEIQRLENNLRAAKPTNDDEFSMFGTGVTKAVREIERETRWRGQRPIGPLGRHVRLMDPEWKRVIEGNLNQSLNAFIVETKHDEDLLRSIFRRHNCRSAIMRSNRGPMPIQEPASHFTTVLRVLEFNDEMARKLLIINHRIEALVLVKTRREGQQLYESNGASYPQNVLAIISQDNYQIGSTRGGHMTTSMPEYHGAVRVLKPTERDTAEIEHALHNARSRLAQAEHHVQQIEPRRRRLQQDLQVATTKIRERERQRGVLERELASLREQLSERTETANVGTLLEEKERINSELDTLKAQSASIIERQRELEDEEKAAKTRLQEFRSQSGDVDERVRQIEAAKAKLVQERSKIDSTMKQMQTKKTEAEASLADVRRQVESARATMETKVAQATQYCARVEVTKTKDQLNRDIRDKEIRLREKTKLLGTREQVERDLINARTSADTAAKRYQHMKELTKVLDESMHKRVKRWRQFRQYISTRASLFFSDNLQKRGYSGKLEFKHDVSDGEGSVGPGKLILKVQTDQSSSQNVGSSRAANTLSGGEKSFSQICLLLALWEAMSGPVRCLDEFDVYMDSVNRNVSMNLLTEEAAKSDNTQYIFITPQDMNALKQLGPGKLKVCRLPDPVRGGQQRLNFGATQE